MKITSQYLYDLLPAYYRILDHEEGEPLNAFIKVLAREAGIVEGNIDQLYENWFIETCEEWVIPYIGELLGVRGVHQINENKIFSRRAYVANTLAYRRRKGTLPILEQLAQDITGWRASAVEFFQLLSATQNLNHLRLHCLVTPNLSQMNTTDLIDTAFESSSHTVDVGSIRAGLGRYNIQNIGIYIWRLNSYPLIEVDAREIPSNANIPDGAYTFNVLGLDTSLFNNPKTEKTITSLAKEINAPGKLRKRGLHDELEAIRQGIADGVTATKKFFEDIRPVIQIRRDGVLVPIQNVTICNLSNWRIPVSSKTYSTNTGDITLPITTAIDPDLGRIVVNDPSPNEEILVSYSYGFSADLGGGPYDRNDSLLNLLSNYKGKDKIDIDWHVGVSKTITAVSGEPIFTSLGSAISAWNALSTEKVGLITIMDSRTYIENLDIKIPEGKTLFIISAQWNDILVNGVPERSFGLFNPETERPHIQGDIEIEGTAPASSNNGGNIVFNGLLIEGNIEVVTGNLRELKLEHCSVMPTKEIVVANQSKIFELNVVRSICGKILVESEDAVVNIKDTIVDNQNREAILASTASLCIEQSTIWGSIIGQKLDASNCIFNDAIEIARRQAGCVRFSFLSLGSRTPKRYRCQPELAIENAKGNLKQQILNRIKPTYNSTSYGHHAYAQLASCTPIEILEGSENGSEMGVFNHLQQPQRITNLNIALEEYIRLGMEAGIIFVT